jgi:hypothetical protein
VGKVDAVGGAEGAPLPEHLRVVYDYAPILFHATKAEEGPERWDFVTAVDFDGDWIGNNNEESLLEERPLPATLYYAVLETETHWYLTYSLFHPLDWSAWTDWLPYNWHENDMENIQVVVRKPVEDEQAVVELVAAQAHLKTGLFPGPQTSFSGSQLSETTALLVDNRGRMEGKTTHPAIYVESGGHGLHSANKRSGEFSQLDPPRLRSGHVFFPSPDNSPDYYRENGSHYGYQLLPTYQTFFVPYLSGERMGDGKLMDGEFDYEDELVSLENLPRHFDSDRWSGPGKSDAGISPFAISYSLTNDDLGVLFFNPAKKYAETMDPALPLSRTYTNNPYLD